MLEGSVPLNHYGSTNSGDKKYFICNAMGMEPLFEIGDVIRKLRLTKAKMDMVPFAKAAGINKNTLSAVENGGNCGRKTLEKIASALNMTVGQLYDCLPHEPIHTERNNPPVGVPLRRRGRRVR